MDGISAAASLIAIGQAIAVLPKLVQALQSLVRYKAELAYLINELEFLRAFIQEITAGVDLFSTTHAHPKLDVPEPTLLKQCRRAVIIVLADIEVLVGKCDQESGGLRLHRLKWVLKSKKISSLLVRSREVRQDMMQACQLMGLHIHHKHGLLLLESVSLHAAVLGTTESPSQMVNGNTVYCDPKYLEQNAQATTVPEDSLPTIDAVLDDNMPPPSSVISIYSGATNSNSEATADLNEQFLQINAITSSPMTCSALCRCQCHRKTEYTSPPWIRPLLGSFLLNYACLPIPRRWKCDLQACSSSRSSVSLTYYFPSWLLYRSILLSASINSMTGNGATLHLKVPRILPSLDDMWIDVVWNRATLFRQSYQKTPVFPFDQDEFGQTLLSCAIYHRSYEIVKFLYSAWQLASLETEYDRLASRYARFSLYSNDTYHLDPNIKSVLHSIAHVVEEEPETSGLNLHRAIREGSDLTFALQLKSEALDEIDIHEQTALHLACARGDTKAVQYLVQAGASLDRQDFSAETPLIIAIRNAHYDCASQLIEHGCNISLNHNSGYQALFYAMAEDVTESYDILVYLISHSHAIVRHPLNGGTPLHWLSDIRCPENSVESLLRLLLDKGYDLHARDRTGHTPVLQAVTENNATVLRLLVQAGARIDGDLSTTGRNVLHIAALFGGLEILQYLLGLEFKLLHVDTGNRWGDTPLDAWRWRMFEDEDFLYADIRRPALEEAQVFEDLLRKIRDTSLQSDIEDLTDMLQIIETRNTVLTKRMLRAIEQRKHDQRLSKDAETLRVLAIEVGDGLWEDVEDVLKEMIQVRRERLAMSPFDERSNHYLPHDPQRYYSTEMEEGSSSEEGESEIIDSDDSDDESNG